ncbi:hypothetical protein [Terasakiella pusilla]|uniref:hypothetical protein n=1 Tax=Terasakiella pusilla TaxID=64973 RepID=UPI003AA7FF04
MLKKTIEFIWPAFPEWKTFNPMQLDTSQQEEANKIRTLDWSQSTDLAIDEAIRISSNEDERLRSVKSKATNILLFIAAFVPFLTFSINSPWSKNIVSLPEWLTMLFFGAATSYLLASAVWALRTIQKAAYHYVYVTDLTKIWEHPDRNVQEDLLKEHLLASLHNQEIVNIKVSTFNMAYAFLYRAIIALAILIFLQLAYSFLTKLFPWFVVIYELIFGVSI